MGLVRRQQALHLLCVVYQRSLHDFSRRVLWELGSMSAAALAAIASAVAAVAATVTAVAATVAAAAAECP